MAASKPGQKQQNYKHKVVAVCAMKACKGSEGTVPLILNLDSKWR